MRGGSLTERVSYPSSLTSPELRAFVISVEMGTQEFLEKVTLKRGSKAGDREGFGWEEPGPLRVGREEGNSLSTLNANAIVKIPTY